MRPIVARRIEAANGRPDAQLFVDSRAGRISTGILHRATDWDDVVSRRGLRYTGLTWFADAGVPAYRLQKSPGTPIGGSRSATCTRIRRP